MKVLHIFHFLAFISFSVALQDECNKPLGLEDGRIKDAQFTALTAYDENIKVYGPQRARLNLSKWPQGYRGNPKSQENSWLSVDFGRGVVITGIATQGYGERGIQEWVTKFMLMYSTQEDDNEKTLAPADRSSEWASTCEGEGGGFCAS
ncbi:lactadherin-like [Nematostella vectensis]|uniref:lactadherin-like n=1 Tax=Nematostella vectensis TaxID=45351 RepID=UPI00207701DE|nr:lactadherin-like [Nematostella vectensis]